MPHRRCHQRTAPPALCATLALLAASLLPSPCPAACIPQDLDGSGAVDAADLGDLLGAWGRAGALGTGDFDGNGEVDGADLGSLLAAWGDVSASACLAVTGIDPTSGTLGDVVTLSGTFPDPDLLDYSVIAVTEDGTVVPFDVVALSATSITARVGPFPAGAAAAHLVVDLGNGNLVPADRLPSGFDYGFGPWVWTSGRGTATSSTTFTFEAPREPVAALFFGDLNEGGLQVALPDDCDAGVAFGIWIRAVHLSGGPDDPRQAVGLRVPSATIQRAQSGVACAEALCGILNSLFMSQTPVPIAGDCTISPISGGFLLGSYVDGLEVNSGAFVFDLTAP